MTPCAHEKGQRVLRFVMICQNVHNSDLAELFRISM